MRKTNANSFNINCGHRSGGKINIKKNSTGMSLFQITTQSWWIPVITVAAVIVFLCVTVSPALADRAASTVMTQVIAPQQSFPMVGAKSESWFDVGGFCKVVSVGALPPPARGVPVFIPGSPDEWRNWRAQAPRNYGGQVVSTTCCRPQADIATLCAGTATPLPVSRQYGRLGETDTLSATCAGPYGPYVETVSVSCAGDNGPDGQASWQAGGVADTCTPNAQARYGRCSSEGVGGWGTRTVTIYNSCGQVQSTANQSCYTPPPCQSNGSCSGKCGGGRGVDNCGNGCINSSACVPVFVITGGASCESFLAPKGCGLPGGCWTCQGDNERGEYVDNPWRPWGTGWPTSNCYPIEFDPSSHPIKQVCGVYR